MAHDKASRMILSKEELVRITLIYQEKSNGLYLSINNDVFGLKSDFSKLEAPEYKSLET